MAALATTLPGLERVFFVELLLPSGGGYKFVFYTLIAPSFNVPSCSAEARKLKIMLTAFLCSSHSGSRLVSAN